MGWKHGTLEPVAAAGDQIPTIGFAGCSPELLGALALIDRLPVHGFGPFF